MNMISTKINVTIILMIISIAVQDTFAPRIPKENVTYHACIKSLVHTFKEINDPQKCYNRAFHRLIFPGLKCPYARKYYGYLARQTNIANVITPQQFCIEATSKYFFNSREGVVTQCLDILKEYGFQQTTPLAAFEQAFFCTLKSSVKGVWAQSYYNAILKAAVLSDETVNLTVWCMIFCDSQIAFEGPDCVPLILNDSGPSNAAQHSNNTVEGPSYSPQIPVNSASQGLNFSAQSPIYHEQDVIYNGQDLIHDAQNSYYFWQDSNIAEQDPNIHTQYPSNYSQNPYTYNIGPSTIAQGSSHSTQIPVNSAMQGLNNYEHDSLHQDQDLIYNGQNSIHDAQMPNYIWQDPNNHSQNRYSHNIGLINTAQDSSHSAQILPRYPAQSSSFVSHDSGYNVEDPTFNPQGPSN